MTCIDWRLTLQRERAAAEREMKKRDLARSRGRHEGRLPRVLGLAAGLCSSIRLELIVADSDEIDEPESEGGPRIRRRRLMEAAGSSTDAPDEDYVRCSSTCFDLHASG